MFDSIPEVLGALVGAAIYLAMLMKDNPEDNLPIREIISALIFATIMGVMVVAILAQPDGWYN